MRDHTLHNLDPDVDKVSSLPAERYSILLVHQDHTLISWFENEYSKECNLKIVTNPDSALTLIKNGYRAQMIFGDVQYFGKSSLDFFVQVKYLHQTGVRAIFSKKIDQDEIRRFADLNAVQKFVTLPRSGPDLRHQIRQIAEQFIHKKRQHAPLPPVTIPDKHVQTAVRNERFVRDEQFRQLERDKKSSLSMYMHSIRMLSNFVPEFHAQYSTNHASTVADISMAVARQLGMDEQSITTISLAAILHDIGKCGMDAKIVATAPENLSTSDFQEYLTHVERGTQIVGAIPGMEKVVDIIAQHHERYDGSGYPNQLEGKQISRESMIVALADLYHNRVYRFSVLAGSTLTASPVQHEFSSTEIEYRQAQAIAYIRQNAAWFEPSVLEAFMNVAKKGDCPPLQLGKADSGNDVDLVDAITRKYIAMQKSTPAPSARTARFR